MDSSLYRLWSNQKLSVRWTCFSLVVARYYYSKRRNKKRSSYAEFQQHFFILNGLLLDSKCLRPAICHPTIGRTLLFFYPSYGNSDPFDHRWIKEIRRIKHSFLNPHCVHKQKRGDKQLLNVIDLIIAASFPTIDSNCHAIELVDSNS